MILGPIGYQPTPVLSKRIKEALHLKRDLYIMQDLSFRERSPGKAVALVYSSGIVLIFRRYGEDR